MYRYQVIRSDNQNDERTSTGLMVSGYAPMDKSSAIFVMVNYAKTTTYPVKAKTIDNRVAKSIKTYTTSAKSDENLKLSEHANADELLLIPPRSVVTVIMEF
jgi:hypothetical protein